MKILIYGLGAVGTVFAAFLKKAENKVYAITKEKYLKDIKDNLISVQGIWSTHQAKLEGIFSSINELPVKDFDVIILSVKSYDTEKAVLDLKKLIKENTFLILAQNGYGNYETAKKYVNAENILLARVIFGAKILKPGKAEVTVNADDVVIGQPENLAEEGKVKKVVEEIKSAGIPARYSREVYKILWDKILYNCALNPLGAILECRYGDLAENKETKEIMNNIIIEIFKVTKAHNIKLNWDNPEDYLYHFYQNLIPPTKKHFPSMYYDIKSGKKTEIDSLNGAIVKLAKEKNIKVPVNETITDLIKFKEKKAMC